MRKIDSGWPGGSPRTKRELWSLVGANVLIISSEVQTVSDVFVVELTKDSISDNFAKDP